MERALAWLLGSDEPSIRHQACRDLLGEEDPGDRPRTLDGPIVQALLA